MMMGKIEIDDDDHDDEKNLKKDRMMFVSTCVACWKAPNDAHESEYYVLQHCSFIFNDLTKIIG